MAAFGVLDCCGSQSACCVGFLSWAFFLVGGVERFDVGGIDGRSLKALKPKTRAPLLNHPLRNQSFRVLAAVTPERFTKDPC